jgi:N-acetylglutamate synthase-like GNAT family acetyltransferase
VPTTNADAFTSIRRAEPADAKGIEALYGELVDSTHVRVLPQRAAELSTDPRTALLVVEQDGELHATALLNFCADAMYAAQPFAVIENIVVGKAFRNRGSGSALLRHIEDECIARDCSKVMLLSAMGRSDAHAFFEHHGFAGSNKKGFVKYRKDFRCGGPIG